MSKFIEKYNFSEKLNNTEAGKYCNKKVSEFGEQLSNNTYIKYIVVRVQPYSNALGNRVTPLRGVRWLLALSYLGFFLYSIIISQGFYLLAYFEGICLLNLFSAYAYQFKLKAEVKDLESQTDVESAQILTAEEGEVSTPVKTKFTEYKLWKLTMILTLICQLLTNFDFLDVPIFWPFLVGYFCFLTLLVVLRFVLPSRIYKKAILAIIVIIGLLLISIIGFSDILYDVVID